MSEAIYNPIIDALADHKPKTLGNLELLVKNKGVSFAQLLQGVVILIGACHLYAVQDETVVSKTKKRTDKLNAHLLNKARGSMEVSVLASPVIGGAVNASRIQQLFVLALSQGKKLPAEWAQFTWQILASQGQKIVKEGKTLETPEENLAELNQQATAFAARQLPIFKALQVV